jgi:hypothetical protein
MARRPNVEEKIAGISQTPPTKKKTPEMSRKQNIGEKMPAPGKLQTPHIEKKTAEISRKLSTASDISAASSMDLFQTTPSLTGIKLNYA